ncbi:hypothetical protein HB825_01985 [Listeria booriae]|uniref:Uncharacterized protein n=1 Tax=Listeria booriae TaxID=1552123 RepID=A0A7X0XC34_9LIST|nr:hypothetical protein [Listeria booriae]MBC1491470.1 hypothetical protein [Listeria booriae]MBC1525497.1 hypothetical protein [Listeria booriae]MBC1530544.1 hypothetical protein [Listeria booriae]MBC2257170.1 hypothetical protein [Listeria booriae]MBC6133606.1 hypothetical protein [Listeria booriae]
MYHFPLDELAAERKEALAGKYSLEKCGEMEVDMIEANCIQIDGPLMNQLRTSCCWTT